MSVFLTAWGSATFYDKGPHPLFWASLRSARDKIIQNFIANLGNYSVIFIAHKEFTNVAAGCIITTWWPAHWRSMF